MIYNRQIARLMNRPIIFQIQGESDIIKLLFPVDGFIPKEQQNKFNS